MLPLNLYSLSDDSTSGYNVGESLRFRSSASAYLSRTPSIAGNRTTWTISFWMKRGSLATGTHQNIFAGGSSVDRIMFQGSTDTISYLFGGLNVITNTTQVFRDPSAWYHVTLVWDTTQLISTERVKLYINGSRVSAYTAGGGWPAQNALSNINTTNAHNFGRSTSGAEYFDGYLAEVNFIDGQALDASYFGKTSIETGQWVPQEYTGTYGNNGFYLDFSDASSLSSLTADKSGNNNNWTANNISLTTGTTYDSMLDSPTNNYCTLQSLSINAPYTANGLINGNLTVNNNASNGRRSTFVITPGSGKYYIEVTITGTAASNFPLFGLYQNDRGTYWPGYDAQSIGYYQGGSIFYNGTSVATVNSFTNGDILGLAYDSNTGKIWFRKNGVWQGTGSPDTDSNPTYINPNLVDMVVGLYTGVGYGTINANFGQQPFAYTPPEGYSTLCSKNLPEPSIKRGETGFDVATYTGNGGNIQVGEYQFPRPNYLIGKSLRFKGVNSYLSRLPTVIGNRKIFTLCLYLKRTQVNSAMRIMSAGSSTGSNNNHVFTLQADNTLSFSNDSVGTSNTVELFKNVDKFLQILIAVDTTKATTNDRVKVYVEGVLKAWTNTVPLSLNQDTQFNNTTLHTFCRSSFTSQAYLEGYLAEVNFIDGQALTPDDFGEFDINGYWIPKAYTGTYGTNGFYLDFADPSDNLGYDASGNNNHWISNNLVGSGAVVLSGDTVSYNYLPFNGSNRYATRTFQSGGNQQKFSISMWVKLNALQGEYLFSRYASVNSADNISIDGTGNITYEESAGGSIYFYKRTNASLSVGTYHHLLFVWDTAQTVADDRLQIWIDGVRQTSFSTATNPPQNAGCYFNNAARHSIGILDYNLSSSPFNGDIIEFYFVDGQALVASDFGQTSGAYWIPKDYTGSFGVTGFHLDVADNTSLTTMGLDASGNGNNWSMFNFPLSYQTDKMIDSPTNNFAIFDSLNKTGSLTVVSNSGLTVYANNSGLSAAYQTIKSTLKASGKIYFEYTYSTGDAYWVTAVGLATNDLNILSDTYIGSTATKYSASIMTSYGISGTYLYQYGISTLISGSSTGNTYAIAYDRTSGKAWASINGVWVNNGNPETGDNPTWIINEDCYPAVNVRNQATGNINFGQRPFTYTPPTGFNTLSIPNIAEYTYDLESPDLVWIKSRNAATNHMLFDSIRGTGKYLSSNLTTTEATDVNSLVSFNKNGFYLGNNTAVNTLNNTYVAWMWKAGSSTVTNTDGTITSQVRANPSKGFSVVKYTGTGANDSVGHGLGLPPKFIIGRSFQNATSNWVIYHPLLTKDQVLFFTSAAVQANANYWGRTTLPTSSIIELANNGGNNSPGNPHILYCFAEIEGYSKFGSYTGNGSADGPFIYCGGSPRFIMIKRINAANDWIMEDVERYQYNKSTRNSLFANSTLIEAVDAFPIDILSNGFKVRNTGTGYNISGGTYIFAAFMYNPFKYSTAR